MRKNLSDWFREMKPELDRMATGLSREVSTMAETNLTWSIGSIKSLTPHLDLVDRLGYTIVCKDQYDIGEENAKTFRVTSSAMVWIRGRIVFLHVCRSLVDESDVDGAVVDTREVLRQWLVDVDAANDREKLAVENPYCLVGHAAGVGHPEHGREDEAKSSFNWNSVIIWTIGGGIWGAVWACYKGRKRRRRRWYYDDEEGDDA